MGHIQYSFRFIKVSSDFFLTKTDECKMLFFLGSRKRAAPQDLQDTEDSQDEEYTPKSKPGKEKSRKVEEGSWKKVKWFSLLKFINILYVFLKIKHINMSVVYKLMETKHPL